MPVPGGLGVEAAGIVDGLGEGVTGFSEGDRVAYAGGPLCGYASHANVPAMMLVKLPDTVSEDIAAAGLLKALTAQYLLRQTYKVKEGDTILAHAAAGGVGLILCQWAKHLGATVIGTVGTEDKADLARANGCDHPLLYDEIDWVAEVRSLTDGKGVPVVYDSVGATTTMKSLDCLAPFGILASFGNASGSPPPIELGDLAAKGSLFVTRPTLFTFTSDRSRLEAMAEEVFDLIGRGIVKIDLRQRYRLDDVVQLHKDMEARKLSGSTIMTV